MVKNKIYKRICPLCGKEFYCEGSCEKKDVLRYNVCYCPDCVIKYPTHFWIWSPEFCPRSFTYNKMENPSYRREIKRTVLFLRYVTPKGKVRCPNGLIPMLECQRCSYFKGMKGEQVICSLKKIEQKNYYGRR